MATTTQTKTTSMISGGSPTIFISDMNRAVKFYTEALGLRIAYRAGDHFCMIDAGEGLMIGLHPPGMHAPAPGTSGATQVGLNVTAPIEDVVEALISRGVKFQGPSPHIIDDKAVKLAFFNDPDGNVIYLCELKQ